MDLASRLAEHLQALGGTPLPDDDGQHDAVREMAGFAAGLAHLTREVLVDVPSGLAVSLLLSRPTGDVTVSSSAIGAASFATTTVRASIAVPLAVPGGAAVLLLQASAEGAFVLLADDLAGQRGAGCAPILVDRHLVLQADPEGARLAAGLADVRAVEQAIGALIGQGRPPAAARQELNGRAAAAELTVPAMARELLAALADRARPD